MVATTVGAAAVLPAAARLPGEDHGPNARHSLALRLCQQRRRGLRGVLTRVRHARRDESRNERRREGRSAPPRHAVKGPHVVNMRWLSTYVLPCCEGVDQTLTRREDIDPGPVVGEIGPATPVGAER